MSVLFIQTAHKCITIYEKNTVNSVRMQWCLLYTTAWCWSRDADQWC